MNKIANTRPAIRRRLLSTVSIFALLVSAYGAGRAEAADDDADRPLIPDRTPRSEQMELYRRTGSAFRAGPSLAFRTIRTSPVLRHTSPVQAPTPPMSFGEEVKLSYLAKNSDWILSRQTLSSIGRSSNSGI